MSKHIENDYKAFFFQPVTWLYEQEFFSLIKTESQATAIDVQFFCLIHLDVGVKALSCSIHDVQRKLYRKDSS